MLKTSSNSLRVKALKLDVAQNSSSHKRVMGRAVKMVDYNCCSIVSGS